MRETLDYASLSPYLSQQRLPLHRLRRDGSNNQLLGRHHRSHPSTLLSQSILVGQRQQRESYLSERICSLSHRLCYQSDFRRGCAGSSDAAAVDTPDAVIKADSSDGSLWYGCRVSTIFSLNAKKESHSFIHTRNKNTTVYLKLNASSLSVCTITILRIISLLQLNFSDLSYNIITTTIWGCLEPCIGIMSACLPILPPLLARLFKCTNTLTWLRDRRPSMVSHPTTTTTFYNTTTWPGTGTGTPAPPTPKTLRPVRRKQQSSHVRFHHRLYDVGNLLSTPSPPPHPVSRAAARSPAPALLANGYDEEEEEPFSCMEMENQSDPESLRKIRISKGWHRSKAGTFAPPSSPRG